MHETYSILNRYDLSEALTEEERFSILAKKRADDQVIEYLIERFQNLHIEIMGEYEGKLFELMLHGKLEGWCWQTTESAIVFLNNDAYIERGYLTFDPFKPKYYHSWICFTYNNTEYVLDPCLNLLCKKIYYERIFETVVLGTSSANEVKEELMRQIANHKENTSDAHKAFVSCLKSIMGEYYEKHLERTKNEVVVSAPEDINTPLYRNNAGYKIETDNGRIRKLTVHYYDVDF